MLYISIELRYQRQLNRICPEIPASFFSSLAATVQRNGGNGIRTPNAFLCLFDDTSVGYAFAASRVISDLRHLLEENRIRLREYFVLVDYMAGKPSADAILAKNAEHENVITPDEGILLSSEAVSRLNSYLSSIPLENTPFSLYSGNRTAEYASGQQTGASTASALVVYDGLADDPVGVLRDMAGLLDVPDLQTIAPGEERDNFEESGHALDIYCRQRFSHRQPGYRIDACFDYYRFLLGFRKKESGSLLPVTVYARKEPGPAVSAVMEKFAGVCAFTVMPERTFLPADLKNLPADLLELSWLILGAIQHLYIDEIPEFLLHLGKQADFIEPLGKWLYSYGLLSDPGDLRSFNTALRARLAQRLGEGSIHLDRLLANFIWKKHEQGELYPSFDLLGVFDTLSFEVSDAFLFSCLYRSPDPSIELERIVSRLKDQTLAETARKMEAARVRYDEAAYDEAGLIAKEVLQVFQKKRIVAGEYRALSLIAMLSFVRNSGDDSIVYLEYALENAEQMHDPYSVLRTRFDMSIVHFVTGNLHFALCELDSVDRLVKDCYAKEWEVLLLFSRGRIAFELGDYRNAELLFQTAASLASVSQIPESVSLCRVWYARCLAHENRFASAENILAQCAQTVPEAYIYLVESALIAGRPLKGIALPEQIEDRTESAVHWSADRFTWKSSFSIAEDRSYGTVSGSAVASRMYQAFSIYYRVRFATEDGAASLIDSMSALSRAALDAGDPYAAWYYFFCYDLGRRTGAVQPSDTAIFLSRSFKYLQKRANEIGDNGLREQFMQDPTWNGLLYREARDNMLI